MRERGEQAEAYEAERHGQATEAKPETGDGSVRRADQSQEREQPVARARACREDDDGIGRMHPIQPPSARSTQRNRRSARLPSDEGRGSREAPASPGLSR